MLKIIAIRVESFSDVAGVRQRFAKNERFSTLFGGVRLHDVNRKCKEKSGRCEIVLSCDVFRRDS